MRASRLLLLMGNQGLDLTPASIEATSGTPQSSNCGAPYALPLVATVKNAGGTGVPGISVTFTAPAGGASGTFASTGTRTETVVTNAAGVATSSAFTANGTGDASAYNVVASVGALSCNFALTNNWTFDYYVANAIDPVTDVVVWYKHHETSGVTCANSGSAGAAADGTATAVTFGQTGPLGANTAVLLDGVNSIITVPNVAAIANLTDFEYVFLVNPASAGENTLGAFYVWGDSTQNYFVFYLSMDAFAAAIYNTLGSVFQTITSQALAPNVPQLLFLAYKNSGDRKLHLYVGQGGVVNELTYTSQPALTGTYRTPTNALCLYNETAQDRTFAGLGGGELVVSGNLTPTQRTQLTVLAGA